MIFLVIITNTFFSQEIYVLFSMYISFYFSHNDLMKNFMPKKQRIASILLYHFIGLTVAIGGWLWEALIFLIKEQRFVNRGFLYGPYLPVYGVGAVLLSVFFYQKRIMVIITYAHLQHANYPQHFYDSPIYTRLSQLIKHTLRSRRTLPASWIAQQPKKIFAKSCSIVSIRGYGQKKSLSKTGRQFFKDLRVFFLCMFGGCLTEFITGWFLLHIFHRKYWDYSGYPMNIAGYICLYSALGFGIVGVLWIKWAGPFLIRFWERLCFSLQILVIGLSDLICITDIIFSLLQPNEGENITFSLFLL